MSQRNATTITLTRKVLAAGFTLGALAFGGYQYATVEDTVRPLTDCTRTTCVGKINGQTAIPAGTYEVRDTWSPRFGRMMLELVGVPGFVGVRVHSGNSADDTEGCIVLGMRGTVTGVAESRLAMLQFNKDVREALKRGPVYLMID